MIALANTCPGSAKIVTLVNWQSSIINSFRALSWVPRCTWPSNMCTAWPDAGFIEQVEACQSISMKDLRICSSGVGCFTSHESSRRLQARALSSKNVKSSTIWKLQAACQPIDELSRQVCNPRSCFVSDVRLFWLWLVQMWQHQARAMLFE